MNLVLMQRRFAILPIFLERFGVALALSGRTRSYAERQILASY
jgi:hypothetical protein